MLYWVWLSRHWVQAARSVLFRQQPPQWQWGVLVIGLAVCWGCQCYGTRPGAWAVVACCRCGRRCSRGAGSGGAAQLGVMLPLPQYRRSALARLGLVAVRGLRVGFGALALTA
jgi:hypothetical protein